MIVKLVQFVTVMLYAMVAGVLWGTWLALARTMTRYDVTVFLADGQHMINNLATIMPILIISTGALGMALAVALFRRGSATAAWLTVAGVLLLVAVTVTTLTVNVPIDNQIKTWTPERLPADWQALRTRWAEFHTLRSFLSLAGLAAMVGAAMTTGPVSVSTDRSGLDEPGARRRTGR